MKNLVKMLTLTVVTGMLFNAAIAQTVTKKEPTLTNKHEKITNAGTKPQPGVTSKTNPDVTAANKTNADGTLSGKPAPVVTGKDTTAVVKGGKLKNKLGTTQTTKPSAEITKPPISNERVETTTVPKPTTAPRPVTTTQKPTVETMPAPGSVNKNEIERDKVKANKSKKNAKKKKNVPNGKAYGWHRNHSGSGKSK